MKNLFVYSCSNGKFGSLDSKNPILWSDEFSFGHIIADKLGYNFINRSLAGSSNFHIFSKIKHDIENSKHDENDIVIILWTYIDRAYCSVEDKFIMPSHTYEESTIYYKLFYNDMQNLASLYGFNEIVKNKIKAKYYYGFSNHMLDLYNADPFIFSMFQNNDRRYLQKDNKNIIEYLKNDKKNFFPCNHANRLGHLRLASLILEFIEVAVKK